MDKATQSPGPEEIKDMKPEELLRQYDRLIWKMINPFKATLANYAWIDETDLYQVSCIALLEAKNAFTPEDKTPFLSIACNKIRWQIFRALNIRWTQAGQMKQEPPTMSLDEPINEEGDITRGDLIPADGETLEEITERADTAARVRVAVHELPEDQEEIINRCFLNDPTESKAQISREKGVSVQSISVKQRKAFQKLQYKLRSLREIRPRHVGLREFKTTMTTEQELFVMAKEKQLERFETHYEKLFSEPEETGERKQP